MTKLVEIKMYQTRLEKGSQSITVLKTLVEPIISTFQSTQKFTLWVLFSCFFEKFTLFLPYCFRGFKANSPTVIGTTLEVLT